MLGVPLDCFGDSEARSLRKALAFQMEVRKCSRTHQCRAVAVEGLLKHCRALMLDCKDIEIMDDSVGKEMVQW
jgi:hypothetical protein